jgi:hypothetical protein
LDGWMVGWVSHDRGLVGGSESPSHAPISPAHCPDVLPACYWPISHCSMAVRAYRRPRSHVPSSDSHTWSFFSKTLASHTMNADHPACYFSILPAVHFSLETPSHSPVSDYQPYTPSDPSHPLLAFRPAPPLYMTSPSDASRLLQLQTQAAHRPAPEPIQQQQRTSSTSSNSSTSSTSSMGMGMGSPLTLSCCRCRRECLANMYQIGTNRYYCSHCARMTGYSAG